MADKKWFYYKRTVMGRWSAQISTVHPKELLDKSAKILREPIELTGTDYDLGLRECEAKWPAEFLEKPETKPTTLEEVEEYVTVLPEDISMDADEAITELKSRGLYDLVRQKMMEDDL